MSSLSKAIVEAIILLQVFVSGVGSLGVTRFTVPYPFGVSPYLLIYLYLNPLLNLIVLFSALVQMRLKSSATRKQTLTFELMKSGIVTALWVWIVVNVSLGGLSPGPPGWLTHGILAAIVTLIVNIVVFYSTLWIAWKRTSEGRIHLGAQSASLLPQ